MSIPCNLWKRFQFINEAFDDAEALRPEGGVGGVEAEGGEKFLVAQRAAGAQQVEVAFGKAGVRVLVDRVERVHQAIAEGVGVDVERRMDEMRDVAPVPAIIAVEPERRPQAFALNLEPDLA